MPYKLFPDILFRTPALPYSRHTRFLSDKDSLNRLLQDETIQDALFLASPVVYKELQKYLKGELTDAKEVKKLTASLTKYLSRMSTRCTPFGLFAACSMGTFADTTEVVVGKEVRGHARLDMFYLCTLAQAVANMADIKRKLRYYPNTTLYELADKYRYVEYKYNPQGRQFHLSAVDANYYTELLLRKASAGLLIEEMVRLLVDEEIEKEEAEAFIEELIDSQLVVSELDPGVTGKDMLQDMIDTLDAAGCTGDALDKIKSIRSHIDDINRGDSTILSIVEGLMQDIEYLKTAYDISYEEKFILQVDAVRKSRWATLSKEVQKEVESMFQLLNKITSSYSNQNLTKFKQEFSARYEEEEIPLLLALDPDIGVGYPADNKRYDPDSFLDGFAYPSPSGQSNIAIGALEALLLQKVQNDKSGNKELVLTDEDFKLFPKAAATDLPDTMSSMIEILKEDADELLIQMSGASGPTGARISARFAHTDEAIGKYVEAIVTKEQELQPDHVILAEISHLPNSRIGNILTRSHLRDYELVYLSNSTLPREQQIYLSDIMISVRNNRIQLRSKRLGKQIIPRLTNAHNYVVNAIPAYHFLADMQHEEGRGYIGFSWGNLSNILEYRPRVRYKNTILSPASWTIKKEAIESFAKIKDDKALIEKISQWRSEKSIPREILFEEGDNKLYVDLENPLSVHSFLSAVKKRPAFAISEFLFKEENCIVKDTDGNKYINEFIITFYKN